VKNTHFQQSDFWASFKGAHGWRFVKLDTIIVLVRTFHLGPVEVSLAYIPLAPEYENRSDTEYLHYLCDFSNRIRAFLPKHTLCIRIDIPRDFYDCASRDSYIQTLLTFARDSNIKLIKNKVDVQPPDTVLLSLEKTEEELLSSMKPKWRYNIKLAEKKGVAIRAIRASDSSFEEDLDSFYALYKETASRDGIGLHPLSYYRDLMMRRQDMADVILFIASHEHEDLAAILVLLTPSESIYLYGCSGNRKRNLMPAYLLQWTAILSARSYSSRVYDFYGIPPTGDPDHPMHGLYLFKTGFGGIEIHRPGSFDIPIDTLYPLYTAAERMRAFWHKIILKKIRGR
jgi:lipid II:glycine glycyltransferase (peptidoglycan interpeptide bridge formation enzyme)